MRADVAASVSRRASGPHLHTALLALLALAALVLSVLAMHSAPNAHVMGIPLPVSASHSAEHELASVNGVVAHVQSGPANHADLAAPQPAGTAIAAMTLTAATLTIGASHDGMLDCALVVMGCVMLLVVAALILFRRSTLVQRSAAAGLSLVSRIFAVEEPSQRPSLTVLCISRV